MAALSFSVLKHLLKRPIHSFLPALQRPFMWNLIPCSQCLLSRYFEQNAVWGQARESNGAGPQPGDTHCLE